MPAMESSRRNPTSIMEKEVNLLKEVQGIFDKFFKWLFGIITFKMTNMGETFFMTHPNIMMALVLTIVLYFLAWLLGTTLQLQISSFLRIITCIILTIGSIASVLALIIISSPSLWLTSPLWAAIFAVVAYFYYQELYKLVVCAVSETIKKLIESYKGQSTRLSV